MVSPGARFSVHVDPSLVYPIESPFRSVGHSAGANAALPWSGSHLSLFPSPLPSAAV